MVFTALHFHEPYDSAVLYEYQIGKFLFTLKTVSKTSATASWSYKDSGERKTFGYEPFHVNYSHINKTSIFFLADAVM
jgi:hypothetical protein